MLIVETITGEINFLALEQEWRVFSCLKASHSVFLSWEWAESWWRVFLKGDGNCLRILLLRCTTTKQLVGIVPFYIEPQEGLLVQRTWRLLGDASQNGQGMTEEPIFLQLPGWGQQVLETLDHYFCANTNTFDHVKLGLQLPLDCILETSLGMPVPFTVQEIRVKHGSSQVQLPTTWDKYLKQISRSMRDNLTYYPRLIGRDGHTFRVELLEASGEQKEACSILRDLHQSRAQSDETVVHVDHMPTETHAEFLIQAFMALAAQGKAFVAVLWIDEVLVAAQGFFWSEGQLTFYYSGYDTAWKKYSPLLVLDRFVLETLFLRGMTTIDLLPGRFPWQERWGATPQHHFYEIRYTRTTPHSVLSSLKYLITKRLL